MKKVLFILNKYCGLEKSESFFPIFLENFQKELIKHDIEISFVFFSKNLINIDVENKHIYEEKKFNQLIQEDIDDHAKRIENDYKFTFKQSFFPDILQANRDQDGKKLMPPENIFNELNPLIFKFLYLEKLVSNNNYDIIFSDVSPEYEMEFGRIIGDKLNIVVIKEMLGSALGKSIIVKCNGFGNFKWIEVQGDEKFDIENTRLFINDFKNSYKEPYKRYFTSSPKINFFDKIKDYNYDLSLPIVVLKKLYNNFLNFYNKIFKEVFLYDKMNSNDKYLFFGFHLLTESTVSYKSLPFTNQIMLIEMISRVLPYNHYLYIREHPHWTENYTYKFLKKTKSFPNVKIINPSISIHDILKSSKGTLTLNATTGIESLMYGKPVLSFSSNMYHGYHSSAISCKNLFDLGKKLSQLINTNVKKEETIMYINRLRNHSVSVCLGSYNFYSLDDSQKKAYIYSQYFIKILKKLKL